ncbi:MAG: tyrosine-type recombinase/integrase, partial [Candidatus Magasanikbacteria bacterium]|nr:tyrosine-type recombinase/integrase [Candidatus Magasanikbacteria bacterium]
MNIADALRQFLEYMEIERNRSPKTVRNYEFYLHRFITQTNVKSPADISLEVVRQFRLWLHRQKEHTGTEIKTSTQNYHLIALRSFLKYLAKRDIKTLAPEKIELAKMPDRQISFLDGNDLDRFLEAPLQKKIAGKAGEMIKMRDKALLELLFSTGLRVSELANLKINDVNLAKDEFSVRGKGGKVRVVFLNNQAKFWLKKYMDSRADFSPFLFVPLDRAEKGREKREGRERAGSVLIKLGKSDRIMAIG